MEEFRTFTIEPRIRCFIDREEVPRHEIEIKLEGEGDGFFLATARGKRGKVTWEVEPGCVTFYFTPD